MSMRLLTPRKIYKPFNYPWSYDYWKLQQQLHWLPEEVPLAEDIKDWEKMEDVERNLITQIFRLFTQSDVEVADNYMEKYANIFKPVEVKMMLASFANIETIHIAAYSYLLDTIGMPEVEYQAFLDYAEMKEKVDFLQTFNVENEEETARTLANFAAFVEGMQLFASFAMLLNFPRFNKMKGMGQIVSWSVRDESLHCEGMTRLYHEYVNEAGLDKTKMASLIRQDCEHLVSLEDAFIDKAFEMGSVRGMGPDDIKKYIRYIADYRLKMLNMKPIYMIEEHPLPWLLPILNGVEHANFFEARATEYSKGATKGEWQDVWSLIDG